MSITFETGHAPTPIMAGANARVAEVWRRLHRSPSLARLTLVLCRPGATPDLRLCLSGRPGPDILSRKGCSSWRDIARMLRRRAASGGFEPWVIEGDQLHGPDVVWDVLWPGADVG